MKNVSLAFEDLNLALFKSNTPKQAPNNREQFGCFCVGRRKKKKSPGDCNVVRGFLGRLACTFNSA